MHCCAVLHLILSPHGAHELYLMLMCFIKIYNLGKFLDWLVSWWG